MAALVAVAPRDLHFKELQTWATHGVWRPLFFTLVDYGSVLDRLFLAEVGVGKKVYFVCFA